MAMLALSFVQCVYHNVYLSLAVYYMFASLRHPYAWSSASNTTQRSVHAPLQHPFRPHGFHQVWGIAP